MVKEELYIIVEGERKQLDLTSPSGITLNFVSNLFNDLSKINASYSYTFKLPRTANNVRVLEIVDDVRADGKFTRIKNDAEYVYDGVSLFSNANMYISGVEKESISAVMTWNVNKGLQELEKHDMSLQELGNHLPEGEYDYVGDVASDYEKDKVVLMGEGTYNDYSDWAADRRFLLQYQSLIRPKFDKFSDYDSSQKSAIPLYSCGIAPYYVAYETIRPVNTGNWDYIRSYPLYVDSADNKLSPMQVICLDETIDPKKLYCHKEGEKGYLADDKGNILLRTYPFPNPVIPVPFLINTISKIYGIKFDIINEKYNSLVLPLVKTEISDALAQLNYITIQFYIPGVSDESAPNVLHCNVSIVNNYPLINPFSLARPLFFYKSSDGHKATWVGTEFNYSVDKHWGQMRALISGKVTIKIPQPQDDTYNDEKYPKLKILCRTYDPEDVAQVGGLSFNDDENNFFYEIGSMPATELRSMHAGGNNYYQELIFNYDPNDGYSAFETEIFYRPVILFRLVWGDNDFELTQSLAPEGSFNIAVKGVGNAVGCHVNLFQNLPDISVKEFVKSIFYALGSYPYQDNDGVIRAMAYEEILKCIQNNNVIDFSKKSILGVGINEDDYKFDTSDVTSLSLGKRNYFLMANDNIDDYGTITENKKTEDAYEHGYEIIEIENATSDDSQTIFKFPFYGGFLWSKGYYAYRDYARISQLTCWWLKFEGEGMVEHYDGDFGEFKSLGNDKWHIEGETYLVTPMYAVADTNTDYSLSRSHKELKFKLSEAKPILGVIESVSVPVADLTEQIDMSPFQWSTQHVIQKTNEYIDYLSMRPWNCATDMPKVNGHDLLQELFGNPCLVKEDMNLNVADLVSLDMEKPVFLEKYNSYFAIKNIEVSSSDGISKVELIRIPTEILEPAPPTPEVIVEPPTVEPTDPEPSDEPEPSASD